MTAAEWIALAGLLAKLPALSHVIATAIAGGQVEEPLASELRKILPEESASGRVRQELESKK